MTYILNNIKTFENLCKIIYILKKNIYKKSYKKNIYNIFFLLIKKTKYKIKKKFIHKHSKYPGGLKKYNNINILKKNLISLIKIKLKKFIKKKILKKIKFIRIYKNKICNLYE